MIFIPCLANAGGFLDFLLVPFCRWWSSCKNETSSMAVWTCITQENPDDKIDLSSTMAIWASNRVTVLTGLATDESTYPTDTSSSSIPFNLSLTCSPQTAVSTSASVSL
ncbi:hypothetical protein OGAPHI_001145 [Ogataea philodendri]|uniref:Secreted protein n=1 Tax=Ogataea philodendri TaxID=1378263 RepID=A0A9P8PFJ5_9ASCO|nr:uncharacterized protein OGAPHI_001145 [Ogataea philodendri]KAH3670630.1 hypothetical protein OGAPHI_001145 [Ogataea philodendri]